MILFIASCTTLPEKGEYTYKVPIHVPEFGMSISWIQTGYKFCELHNITNEVRVFEFTQKTNNITIPYAEGCSSFPIDFVLGGTNYVFDAEPDQYQLKDNRIRIKSRGPYTKKDLKYLEQNQRFDPIVKTPVDEVEAQGTQGHP